MPPEHRGKMRISKKTKKIFTFCILFLIMPIIIYSRSIWVEKNLYSSGDNLNIGDVITVVINDIGQLQFDVSLKNNTSNSVESNPDINITGFLPNVTGSRSAKSTSDLNYTERRRMSLSVGARVQSIDANGQFVIAGSRVYNIQGTANTVTVNGIIDPTRVRGGFVDSTDVADFRLGIIATSEGIRIRRPPLEEDESGTLTLTEQEKRDMLIRYFEQMIDSLER